MRIHVQFSDPDLCTAVTSRDSDYVKYVIYNPFRTVIMFETVNWAGRSGFGISIPGGG